MSGPEQAMDGNQYGNRLASPGPGQHERANPRYSVDEDCVLMLVSHGMSLKARVIDLSLEGCRVRTSDRFIGKAGRPVEITFKVNGCAFRFSGVVRWSDGQHLVGIHFENMIPRRKAELTEVIEEMAAAAAARAEAARQLVAESAAPGLAVPKLIRVESRNSERAAACRGKKPAASSGKGD